MKGRKIAKKDVYAGKYDEKFLSYFLNGFSYKQIGEYMDISKYYISMITKYLYRKFNAVNNASLACQVAKRGIKSL
ncbi:response regulator transcription factor [bacterium]|nr:response regulator transcription factor [bacterium]